MSMVGTNNPTLPGKWKRRTFQDADSDSDSDSASSKPGHYEDSSKIIGETLVRSA